MTEHDPSFDDDDELELEPLDPEILKHQQERTKRKVREAEDSVDINEVYDQEVVGDPVDLDQLKNFRFTTRHLLIATAVLAMVMTLFVQLEGCMGFFVSGCIALAAGWYFVLREEKRRIADLELQREEFARRNAARRAIEDGKPLPESFAKEFDRDADEEDEATARIPAFRFSFSMKEVLVTFAVAAVILGCSQILGFDNAALMLGFVALLGLLVQALGIELPPLITLGWWLLMLMYIAVSLLAVMRGS